MSDARDVAIDRLRHMLEAARSIEAYVARGRDVFDADAAVRDAILYQIIVLGEAAKAVAKVDSVAHQTTEIEWSVLA